MRVDRRLLQVRQQFFRHAGHFLWFHTRTFALCCLSLFFLPTIYNAAEEKKLLHCYPHMADSSTTSSSSSSSSNNNTNNNAPSAGRPQVSRSTSVTKSTRTTHQRKPSLNIPSNLYPIPEKVTLNNTNANIMPPPPLPSSSSVVPPPSSPKRLRSSSSSFSWRTLLHRIDFFLKPSGPLLPQDKHGAAFGGTGKKSRISQIVRSRSVRFLFLFYVVFSVFLSINHLWHWMFGADTVQLDARFGDQWKPQRPYDQGKRKKRAGSNTLI
ncbi:hypothetical protein BDB00DRAFT_108879 [Zychaea mexicana]|uniref:uncharacterized protein n=1 Tax=Zychaea mexicana TaxID=64656 RepID=UPI0022FF0059|nr:uncharacterized protein BDB00DRAFT_108879 [Zychaea mexicana]KAI9484871.1 hypothetical protein BDB00DRAFT_108879 [Zychaea mexicana]